MVVTFFSSLHSETGLLFPKLDLTENTPTNLRKGLIRLHIKSLSHDSRKM